MELGIATIYATALYDAATELGHVKEVRQEIEELCLVTKDEKRFLDLMTNPGLDRAKKKAMLRGIFEGKIHDEVMNFLCVLVDKGRLHAFPYVVRQYARIDDENNSCCDGVIWSAVPLSEKQLAKFEEQAGKLLRKKVTLRNQTDPKLIGGVRLFVDGRVVDASLAYKLEEIRERITNN